MKKILGGKLYNTETAKQVGVWSNGGSCRDFSHIEESLYQKKTGEFFLFGEGGPRTKYAESAGQNQWTGGSQIIPLTWEAARQWAEQHLDADDYEAIFGPVTEDDSRATVTLSLSTSAVERAKRVAVQKNLSLSSYIESLIDAQN